MNRSSLVPVVSARFRVSRIVPTAALLCALAWLSVAMSASGALIGYWKFDEGTGTAAADSSGVASPHNGTLGTTAAGAQVPAWIAGRFGSALDFNRLNDNNGGRVSIPYQVDLQLND